MLRNGGGSHLIQVNRLRITSGSDRNGTYLSPKEAFSGSSTGKKESETPALLLGNALFRSALAGSKLAFSLK